MSSPGTITTLFVDEHRSERRYLKTDAFLPYRTTVHLRMWEYDEKHSHNHLPYMMTLHLWQGFADAVTDDMVDRNDFILLTPPMTATQGIRLAVEKFDALVKELP